MSATGGEQDCCHCGKPRPPRRAHKGHQGRFCGPSCYQKWMVRRRPKMFTKRACLVCGKEYTATGTACVRKKYCSSDCRQKATYAAKVAKHGLAIKGKTGLCVRCGTGFDMKIARQRFCSRDCSRAWQNEEKLLAGQTRRGLPRRCAGCGMLFSQRLTGCQRYCSRLCYGRVFQAKRRAKMLGVPYDEWPNAETIIERDGPNCRNCGVFCVLPFDVKNKNSATVDHIIPVAMGGTWLPSNAQLLCLSCNARKRDSLPQEINGAVGVGESRGRQ